MVDRLISVGDAFELPPSVKVLDGNLPTRLGEAELSATIADYVSSIPPEDVIFADDFTEAADGALSGRVAPTGQSWIGSGTNPPQIIDGGLVCPGTGYAWMETGTTIRDVEFEFEMRGSGTERNVVLALARNNNVINNLVHFTVNHRQIIVDFVTENSWSTGKQPGYVLNFANWLLDGRSYRVRLSVDGEAATVTGPHGERFSFVDNRVKLNAKTSFFLEPLGATAGNRYPAVLRVTAGKAPSKRPLPLDAPNWNTDENGNLAGNRYTGWEASLGRQQSGLPGIQLGAKHISTFLTKAHNIGDLALETASPLLPGVTTVFIDPDGANGETVTLSGNSGTGATSGTFSRPITAGLTKAHPVGTRIYALNPRFVTIEYNPTSQFTKLPNQSYVDGALYLSANLDATLSRVGANTAGVSSNQMFRTGRGATASRPAATMTGAQWYDETLKKPIWWDGAAWRDAAGTAV